MERRWLLDLGHRYSGDSVCDVMWALLLHCCGYWLGSSHSVQAKKNGRSSANSAKEAMLFCPLTYYVGANN